MQAFSTRYRILWGGLAICAGAALSLLRSRGPGSLNSVWIEDAQVFLNDALTDTLRHNLFKSLNGYYHIGPRVLAEIVSLFPVSWSAVLLSTSAALITASYGAIAYTAGGQFIEQWWLRLFVAAPVVLLPLARTQADNDVATLQFPGLYALFWLMLWRPASKTGQVVAVGATAFIAFSSIIPAVLAPLAIWRLWKMREWFVPLAYFAGMGLHFLGLALGKASRSHVCCQRYDPVWVLNEYVTWLVPRALLGERWLGGPGVEPSGNPVTPTPAPNIALIVLAWAIVLAAIACALTKVTRPHWPLAAAALGFSLVLFAAITNSGFPQPRYLIAPALLFYVALAAVLRPHKSAWPAIGVIAVLSVAVIFNFRVDNGRTTTWPWDQVVRNAQAACADPALQEYVQPGRDSTWWHSTIPCERVRNRAQ
ncbi:hypothetical protein [Allorhizocola rhizosphaerae]|uniref:hypothetical protein n=1 Tax=Allorhizocola rhizosphaerae TaxID=1872709 RepID=UPI000E3E23F7|nr:hypothetical protein [Allorhizocola rhizosphaerae]